MKFLFGDRVKVVSGFYQGAIGFVSDYSGPDNKYYFDGYKVGARFIRAWINELELKKVEA